MNRLEISGLTCGFDGRIVLENVDMILDGAGLYCIAGPNGVGKTTLVKCIDGLCRPESGSIIYNGQKLLGMPPDQLAKIVAYVPNGVSNAFSISVTEAVMMGRHPYSGWISSNEDLEIADRIMRLLDLQDIAEKSINELSSGQLQRVMIARGLAQEPGLLILDEPTSNLDARYQMELTRFIKGYAKEKNVMVLMICHDLSLVSKYADKTILLSRMDAPVVGTVDEVLTSENISRAYDVRAEVRLEKGERTIVISEADARPFDYSIMKKAPSGERKGPSKDIVRKVTNAAVVVLLLLAAFVSVTDLGDGGDAEGGLVGTTLGYDELPDSSSRLWVYGNANEDDRLDSDDLDCLAEIVAGEREPSVLADANCDGRIDSDDIEYLERILASDSMDVYYVDNYNRVAKVSWPVQTIAIGYCSGAYIADLTGLCGKVTMVDSTIRQYWSVMNSSFASADSYGTTEMPDYELMMEKKIDVYVPGYCDSEADKLSASNLNPAGIDVMFVNTCDNSGVDRPNEHIDRSILMFAYLLQGDMEKTYDYLSWHDDVLAKLEAAAATIPEDSKAPFMMSRSYPDESTALISITGKDNINNIHAEWVGVDAVGQHSPLLPSNYNKLNREQIITVIQSESRGGTFYYMDNEHDGIRGTTDLDEAVRYDKQMLKDCGIEIHYMGMAREAGNSPLYIIELAFYQNVMYPDLQEQTGLDYRDLFDYYFEHFAMEDYRSYIHIENFFADYGVDGA